jgi:hypothetical protein
MATGGAAEVPRLDLSVVIRCAGEREVFRCLDSIDAPVDLVVTLPADTTIRAELEGRGARVVDVPRMQQGLATNAGVAAATAGSVVIMDSDCWFQPGTLAALAAALVELPVVRTKVVYESSPQVAWSRTIAGARDFDNQGDQRYWFPGLGIRKSTIDLLGGELCHPGLWWVEDADVHDQLEELGLTAEFHQVGVIHHGPISLRHELRSQVKYGKGGAMRALLRGGAPRYFGRHASYAARVRTIHRSKGLAVTALKAGTNVIRTTAMALTYRRLRRTSVVAAEPSTQYSPK